MEKKERKRIDKIAKNLKNEPVENPVSTLEVHTVEPVVKPQDKRKKPKGEITDGTKKTGTKPGRKTDPGTIKESKEKPEAGEKSSVAVPNRRRGFFDWMLDGGKEEGKQE